jgi:hypothetical protein
LDEKTSRHFAEIIELAESVFENVIYEIDATPDRSILRIDAEYGKYQIFVTELFSAGIRKYRITLCAAIGSMQGMIMRPIRVLFGSNMGKSEKNMLGNIFLTCIGKINLSCT